MRDISAIISNSKKDSVGMIIETEEIFEMIEGMIIEGGMIGGMMVGEIEGIIIEGMIIREVDGAHQGKVVGEITPGMTIT